MSDAYYSPTLDEIIKIAKETIYIDVRDEYEEVDIIPLVYWQKGRIAGRTSFVGKKTYALYKRLGGNLPRERVVVMQINFYSIFLHRFNPLFVLRLVDHEMEHIRLDFDPETEKSKVILVDHDIEEFISVMRRWQNRNVSLGGALGKTAMELPSMIKPIEREQSLVEEYIRRAQPLVPKLVYEAIEEKVIPERDVEAVTELLKSITGEAD